MKIKTGSTRMETVRHFVIVEDCPIVPMAYARPPKEVRIVRGYITYRWHRGEWNVQNDWSVSISGTVLKKDGTDSKNDHSRQGADWPWLNEIIDLLRPAGNVAYASFEAPYEIGQVLG